MSNHHGKSGLDTDLRSLLKNQHKKVYSICRFFTNNYKEHQQLFADIIAAASQNIRSRKNNSDKQVLLYRACINMTALHMITREMEPVTDRSLQFKSPDYQRSMTQFRESMGEVSDYEKYRLFLEFEKVPTDEMAGLTGINHRDRKAARAKESEPAAKKHFLPYLMEKWIWS